MRGWKILETRARSSWVPEGKSGVPSPPADARPPDSTTTAQRPSRMSYRPGTPHLFGKRRESPLAAQRLGELRPARPCVGEKVPSRGGRAQLQPAPQARPPALAAE
ncbi:uncharacterized protein ACBT57_023982 isoform 2-T2 [Dama dama]